MLKIVLSLIIWWILFKTTDYYEIIENFADWLLTSTESVELVFPNEKDRDESNVICLTSRDLAAVKEDCRNQGKDIFRRDFSGVLLLLVDEDVAIIHKSHHITLYTIYLTYIISPLISINVYYESNNKHPCSKFIIKHSCHVCRVEKLNKIINI